MLLKNPCFSFSCFHKNPCFLLQKIGLSPPPFRPSTPPLGGQKVSPPLEPFLGIQQFLRHSPPPSGKKSAPMCGRGLYLVLQLCVRPFCPEEFSRYGIRQRAGLNHQLLNNYLSRGSKTEIFFLVQKLANSVPRQIQNKRDEEEEKLCLSSIHL